MRLRTIRRRLRASLLVEEQIRRIYNLMDGFPDELTVLGKPYNDRWSWALGTELDEPENRRRCRICSRFNQLGPTDGLCQIHAEHWHMSLEFRESTRVFRDSIGRYQNPPLKALNEIRRLYQEAFIQRTLGRLTTPRWTMKGCVISHYGNGIRESVQGTATKASSASSSDDEDRGQSGYYVGHASGVDKGLSLGH